MAFLSDSFLFLTSTAEYMTKIDNISDVNLSAVEDIGNIVFKSISTALNLTLLYFCHVLNFYRDM